MKVTIEYNDKKIDVELTAEQIKELGLQEEKKTGWERAEYNETYYYINDGDMAIRRDTELATSTDIRRYDAGNYFTDTELAVKMCKRVKLMLKMQRWADEHNEPIDWNTIKSKRYYRIGYNIACNELRVYYDRISRLIGVIYFSSYEIAEKAIEEFGDEIIECYAESEVTR